MPNLLLFAPCEKAIVDQNNTASLIGILEEIQIQVVAGVPIPAGMVVPMQWVVMTLWEKSSGYDTGRVFEQRTILAANSGKHLIEGTSEFRFEDEKPRLRVMNQILGMPISEPGPHKVQIWLREKATEPKEWKEIAVFPLVINLIQPPAANSLN